MEEDRLVCAAAGTNKHQHKSRRPCKLRSFMCIPSDGTSILRSVRPTRCSDILARVIAQTYLFRSRILVTKDIARIKSFGHKSPGARPSERQTSNGGPSGCHGLSKVGTKDTRFRSGISAAMTST